MTNIKLIKENLLKKKDSFRKMGISKVGIFGSYVRGEETSDSDVDIMIELSRPSKIDLLDLVNLEQELSAILATKVEIVIKSSLKPALKESILSEVQYL